MRLTLKQLLGKLKGLKGHTLVTGHSLADMDAVASSVVLASFLPNAEPFLIDRMRSSAKNVLEKSGMLPSLENRTKLLSTFQNLVLADVSNADMLGPFAERLRSFREILCIDHHEHNRALAVPTYVDATRTSCSEVIFEISKGMRKKLNATQAALLACGLLEDSALLKSANTKTIKALSELLQLSKRELPELVSWLVQAPSANEREEALKALQQTRIERIGETLLAVSQTPAFESRVAALLVQTGADFALAYNPKQGKISVLKDRNPALKKLHVGKAVERVANQFNGSGGGHEFIGGLRVPPSRTSAAVELLLSAARKKLEPKLQAHRKS